MLAAWTSLHRATLLGHHAVGRYVPSWALWRLGVTISRVQKIDLQKTMHLWRAGLVAVQLQRQNHFFRAWHVFLRSQCRCTALKRYVLAMWMTLVDESRDDVPGEIKEEDWKTPGFVETDNALLAGVR